MECAIFHKKRSAKRNNKESTIIFSIDILKQLKCRNGIYLFNESNIVKIIISLNMHMHEQILTFCSVWAFLFILLLLSLNIHTYTRYFFVFVAFLFKRMNYVRLPHKKNVRKFIVYTISANMLSTLTSVPLFDEFTV